MTGGKPLPVDASIIAVPAAQIIISTALREFRKACILFKYVAFLYVFGINNFGWLAKKGLFHLNVTGALDKLKFYNFFSFAVSIINFLVR